MIKQFKPELDITTHMDAWYIDPKICDDILKYKEDNKHLMFEGKVTMDNIVKKESKESLDLPINFKRYDYPWKNYVDSLHECLRKYSKKYETINNLNLFGICEDYVIQQYPPGGGFKKWHYERDGTTFINLKRCLVFMTYLNDVDNAGTDFYYQKLSLPCKKGLTVIWPADWTHTHKGIINNKQSKAIVTGWFSYYYKDNIC
tara:strand:+ start:3785 stop:4390 length:606 start_codon:yes stop_codon:yes gene_type:complete